MKKFAIAFFAAASALALSIGCAYAEQNAPENDEIVKKDTGGNPVELRTKGGLHIAYMGTFRLADDTEKPVDDVVSVFMVRANRDMTLWTNTEGGVDTKTNKFNYTNNDWCHIGGNNTRQVEIIEGLWMRVEFFHVMPVEKFGETPRIGRFNEFAFAEAGKGETATKLSYRKIRVQPASALKELEPTLAAIEEGDEEEIEVPTASKPRAAAKENGNKPQPEPKPNPTPKPEPNPEPIPPAKPAPTQPTPELARSEPKPAPKPTPANSEPKPAPVTEPEPVKPEPEPEPEPEPKQETQQEPPAPKAEPKRESTANSREDFANSLWSAGTQESVEAAVKAGADVNAANVYGNTALLIVVAQREPDLAAINALIKAGANLNEGDAFGCTALIRSVKRSDPKLEVIAALLDAGADVTVKDQWGHTAADYAGKNRNLKATDILKRLESTRK